jgi:seryl-tRNA synthetase
MDNLKRSIKETTAEIKRLNKQLSSVNVEILRTTQNLHHRLDTQKDEWIAQGVHSEEMIARCNELTKSIGNIIRQNRLLTESFYSDKAEIEQQIADTPKKQLELKLEAVRRLRDLTVIYLGEGTTQKRQTLSEVQSQQEKLEAFISSLRDSP